MPEPRLSIVTITYKDSKGLRETIESLRELDSAFESNCPWEHIIVDSSPAENVATLRLAGSNLVHVTTPAEGVYAAINTGLARARGEYIWFLNGGDRLRDRAALCTALEAFRGTPGFDLVVSGVELQRAGHYLYLSKPSRHVARSLVGMNRICQQGVVYRRSVFARTGPFSSELKIAADYEHHLKCLAAGLQIKALPQNLLAIYDMSGRSTQYRDAFAEFRLVQQKLRSELPVWVNMGNALIRPLEYGRIGVQKYLAQSPLADMLRPLWLGFKRKF